MTTFHADTLLIYDHKTYYFLITFYILLPVVNYIEETESKRNVLFKGRG